MKLSSEETDDDTWVFVRNNEDNTDFEIASEIVIGVEDVNYFKIK